MAPRPICPHCHRYMGVLKTAATHLIGREGNYEVIVECYRCLHHGCPGRKEKMIRPPNPYAGYMMLYDYEVQAQACYIRWMEHATYAEVVLRLHQRYGIDIDESAVELFLKTYEIGCTQTYREAFLSQIHDNGGILLCVDVMEPLQGQDGFLVAYDAWSTLTLGSYRMPNNKQATYEGFLGRLKARVQQEIGEPIVGIISDALPMQREAIESVFPHIPHCLCHYHFFNLVLKSVKALDSQVVTQLREELRGLYDLKQYQFRCQENAVASSQYARLEKFLDPLVELGNWRRKPNDPCLIGIVLAERIGDIRMKLEELLRRTGGGRIRLSKYGQKVAGRVVENLRRITSEVEPEVRGLKTIRGHLSALNDIMDEFEASAEMGLTRMTAYCDALRPRLGDLKPLDVEFTFLTALLKFVDTKGPLLFNYREICGGQTTNNALELRFKQLKHFLRRTIGHAAAKYYLMMHGERIFFVNPREPADQITSILKNMNQSEARTQIRKERLSQDRLGLIIHDDVRWSYILGELDSYLSELESYY